MAKRPSDEERVEAAKKKLARLETETRLKAEHKADKEARGPSPSALNRLGAEWRILGRAAEIASEHADDEIDPQDDVAQIATTAINELAKALEYEWRAGLVKKQQYAEKHEAGQAELDKVHPLEGQAKE